jgi:hypothetical protein
METCTTGLEIAVLTVHRHRDEGSLASTSLEPDYEVVPGVGRSAEHEVPIALQRPLAVSQQVPFVAAAEVL